jgi:hypothetical protein
MMEKRMQRELKYFIAHFGEKGAAKYPVHDGCYPVPSWLLAAQIISEGDLILLSCWSGHRGLYGGAAWGIGKVTRKAPCKGGTAIYYEPKPSSKPVARAKILACLPNNLKGKFIMGPVRKPL